MLKHPAVFVTVACIYLAALANSASTTRSRAETEISNYTNDVARTTVSQAQTASDEGSSENSDNSNSETASTSEQATATSVSTVLKQTTADPYLAKADTGDLQTTYVSPAEKFAKGILIAKNKVSDAIGKLPIIGSIKNEIGRDGSKVGDILNYIASDFNAVFPGTYWCGAGNDAPSEDDLGVFHKTDACCKEHDSCNSSIAAGDNNGKLLNNGIFTRSHCDCDGAFYDCLKKANTIISTKIGATYFNILTPQCFKEEYPIIGCNRYESIFHIHRKCLEYTVDYKQNKTVQWFDNQRF